MEASRYQLEHKAVSEEVKQHGGKVESTGLWKESGPHAPAMTTPGTFILMTS